MYRGQKILLFVFAAAAAAGGARLVRHEPRQLSHVEFTFCGTEAQNPENASGKKPGAAVYGESLGYMSKETGDQIRFVGTHCGRRAFEERLSTSGIVTISISAGNLKP